MLKKIENIFHHQQKYGKVTYILFFLTLLCILYLSIDVRFSQYELWQKYPDNFFANGTPILTSFDSYDYIRYAKDSSSFNNSDTLFYPDNIHNKNHIPIISVILSWFVKITGKDYYESAIYIAPLISSIFIISLCIYFFVVRYPVAGLFGGLLGTFAPMYFGKTLIGKYNNDGLNFFLLFTSSLFLLLASNSKKSWQILLYSSLLGIAILLLNNGIFNVIYLILLVVFLILSKTSYKNIIFASLLYILLSNPLYLFAGIGDIFSYIADFFNNSKSVIPNINNTISDAQNYGFNTTLSFISLNIYIALFGLLFFIIFFVTHFKIILPLMPIFFFGLISFFSSGKYAMFLGVFVGVGLGYFLTLVSTHLSLLMKEFRKAKSKISFYKVASLSFAFISVFFVCSVAIINATTKAYATISNPLINPYIYQVFKEMNVKLPKNAVIYTWWDYGSVIADTAGLKVFHSEVSNDTIKTWLIAKSFYNNQENLYKTISYINNNGMAELNNLVNNGVSINEIYNIVSNYNEPIKNDNVYVLLTGDMAQKFYPISYIATNNPVDNSNSADGFIQLLCTEVNDNNALCNGMNIDLNTGVVDNGNSYFDNITWTNNGTITKQRNFQEKSGVNLILNFMDNTYYNSYLFNKNLEKTSFFTLYFLNNNIKHFKLIMDYYPYGKLFQVVKD